MNYTLTIKRERKEKWGEKVFLNFTMQENTHIVNMSQQAFSCMPVVFPL